MDVIRSLRRKVLRHRLEFRRAKTTGLRVLAGLELLQQTVIRSFDLVAENNVRGGGF